jgi:hypothetical protein
VPPRDTPQSCTRVRTAGTTRQPIETVSVALREDQDATLRDRQLAVIVRLLRRATGHAEAPETGGENSS